MPGSDDNTFTAAERRFVVVVQVLFWAFWSVALYVMAQLRALEPQVAADEGAAVFLALFALIWLASTLTLGQRLFARGPTLSVSPEGLLDRRVFNRVIPWAEVVAVRPKGGVLTLTVRQPYRFRWLSGLLTTALPFLKPLLELGQYRLALTDLDRSRDEVVAAVGARVRLVQG